MADPVEKSRAIRTLSWLVAVAVCLPLIYALSIGPAIVADAKVPQAWRAPIEAFYAPVVWLDRNTFLKTPLDYYFHFWVGFAERI